MYIIFMMYIYNICILFVKLYSIKYRKLSILPFAYFFITSQLTFLLSTSRPLVGSSKMSV